MNVFTAFRISFLFLFGFAAAGVVPCGGRKTSGGHSAVYILFCPLDQR